MSNGLDIINIPSAKEGAAYFRIDGQNRKAFELASMTAQVELKLWEKQLLGNAMEQTKVIGAKGNGKLKIWHMTSDFMQACTTYLETRVFPAITIQAYHEDPASTVGRLEILLTGVTLKRIPLFHIDEETDGGATEEIDFSFSGYQILDHFQKPAVF